MHYLATAFFLGVVVLAVFAFHDLGPTLRAWLVHEEQERLNRRWRKLLERHSRRKLKELDKTRAE